MKSAFEIKSSVTAPTFRSDALLRRRRLVRHWCGCRGPRGARPRVFLLLHLPQTRDRLLMLIEILRERMSARPVGHEEQLLRPRRIGGGLERSPARVGDRSRRKALDDIRII